ncbi:MAG: hypothetical protein RL885_18740 [Planctomycetota bacterium]
MLDIDEITDADGKKHDWRKELAERLISLQNEDGSWANDKSARWWENEPALATSYAVQALAATLPSQR